MFVNELIFFSYIIFICVSLLVTAKIGEKALTAIIALFLIFANLFVSKQIILFGFNATAADIFAAGVLLGVNMLQKFFGEESSKESIKINAVLLLFYLVITKLHTWYIPSAYDTMSPHFNQILGYAPRITITALIVFTCTQRLSVFLYSFFKSRIGNIFSHTKISIITLIITQALDTIAFTFIALYGIVSHPWQIIIISLSIKIIFTFFSSFLLLCAKFFIKKDRLRH